MSCLCRFLYGILYDLLMSVTMQPDGHVPKLLYSMSVLNRCLLRKQCNVLAIADVMIC